MKRIVVICLALALLAGCAPAEEVSSSGVSSVAQTAQEPAASVFSVGALDNVRWSDYGAGSNGGDAYYELATLTEKAKLLLTNAPKTIQELQSSIGGTSRDFLRLLGILGLTTFVLPPVLFLCVWFCASGLWAWIDMGRKQ